MDVLSGLNPAQREAVETAEGPLLILAGPGSGKTRVIAHRIAYLIAHQRVHPRRILAVTFTNKAAREMRDRVFELVGGDIGRDITLGTFHAVCSRILRVDGERIGLSRAFAIYDDADLHGRRHAPGHIQHLGLGEDAEVRLAQVACRDAVARENGCWEAGPLGDFGREDVVDAGDYHDATLSDQRMYVSVTHECLPPASP